MPTYLLDTNAISDIVRDHPNVRARLRAQTDLKVTSVISQGEIRYGLERLPAGKKRRDLEKKTNSVLKALPVEPVTDTVAEEYGRLKRALELRDISLQDNDLWIACTAKILGATLVSRDQIFSQIPGLQVEDWTK
jgi:predicted nucleic acid-binding protein